MIETPEQILDRHLQSLWNNRIGQLQRTAGVRLEELLTDVGLSQGETHVLALLADGAAHTVGELQHDLAPPVHIERHPRSSRVPGTDSPRPQHSSTFFVPGRSV